jgi:hypothetical protein
MAGEEEDGTTGSGGQYRRATLTAKKAPASLTEAVLMMEDGVFEPHTAEDIVEFMDESDRVFRDADRFVTHIPPAAEKEAAPIREHETDLPALRAVQPHLARPLRKHGHFRYLMAGIPSCAHPSEAALVQALRVQAGIEPDGEAFRAGPAWRFLFVRADERTEAAEYEDTRHELPQTGPELAAYYAPVDDGPRPLDEFVQSTTSDEDKNSILEDLAAVSVKVEPSEFRVLDWWVELG